MRTQGNIVIGNLQQTSCYLTDTGIVDAYFVSFLPPITGYTDGLEVTFKAINSNTGPCTLEVDGYGAVPIVKEAIQALSVGDILAGEIVNVIYDGTYFQMIATPQVNATPFGTFRVDGGEIVWVANLDYSVSAANYVILGLPYNSDLTAITLAPADPTFDRIDLVVADTSNNVVVITGSATSDPQEPSYDPATQIPLSFINVAAGSTSPSCALLTTIYKENLGGPTEWAAVSSSGSTVVNSTSNPRTGTKDIEGTAVPAATTITFTAPAAFDITNTTQLDLYIRSKGSWGTTANGHRISITFNIASGQIGVPVIIPPRTAFGFDSSTVGSYQQIAIDRALFNIPDGAMITSIVFTIGGVDGSMGFYIDDISLEQNCILPVTLFNNGLTKTANTVQLGGTLIKNTLNHTASFIHTLQGATVFNYPYQVSQIQAFQNATSVMSFLSRGSNVPTAPDFNNLVRLGINYTGSQYDDSPAIIGYLNDKNAYLISTNIKGHASFGLDTDNSAAKITAIALHTFDSGYTDAITFIGKQPPNVNQAIGILSGTALEPYRIATMHTDGAFTLWKYGSGTFTNTPIYALGVTASGSVIEYSPSGGVADRFGVNAEDDTATQDRDFNAGTHPIHITGTRTTTNGAVLTVENTNNVNFGSNGIVGKSILSSGVFGIGSSGVTGTGSSTGVAGISEGFGLYGETQDGTPGQLYKAPITATTGVFDMLQFILVPQNTATNGLSMSIPFKIANDSFISIEANRINSTLTDVTTGAEVSQLDIIGINAGTINSILSLKGSGQLQGNQYGSGTFTGTPTFNLSVDSSGNVIETAIGGGSARFGVSGEDDTSIQTRNFNLDTFTFDIQGSTGSYFNINLVDPANNNSTGEIYVDASSPDVYFYTSDGVSLNSFIDIYPAQIDFNNTNGNYTFANLIEDNSAQFFVTENGGYLGLQRINPGCRTRTMTTSFVGFNGTIYPNGASDLSTLSQIFVSTFEVYNTTGDDTAWADTLDGRTVIITKVGDPTVTATVTLTLVSSNPQFRQLNVSTISATPYVLVDGEQFTMCIAVPADTNFANTDLTFTGNRLHTLGAYTLGMQYDDGAGTTLNFGMGGSNQIGIDKTQDFGGGTTESFSLQLGGGIALFQNAYITGGNLTSSSFVVQNGLASVHAEDQATNKQININTYADRIDIFSENYTPSPLDLILNLKQLPSATTANVLYYDTTTGQVTSGAIGGLRFGVSGEDDTAGENRHFDATGYFFTVENSSSFSLQQGSVGTPTYSNSFVSGANGAAYIGGEFIANQGAFGRFLGNGEGLGGSAVGVPEVKFLAYDFPGTGLSTTVHFRSDYIKFETTNHDYRFDSVFEYIDNADALANGLVAGSIYRTGDLLKIVH